ncbi:MAG: fork head domain-containing protein, partial [Olpidium bornovanus]
MTKHPPPGTPAPAEEGPRLPSTAVGGDGEQRPGVDKQRRASFSAAAAAAPAVQVALPVAQDTAAGEQPQPQPRQQPQQQHRRQLQHHQQQPDADHQRGGGGYSAEERRPTIPTRHVTMVEKFRASVAASDDPSRTAPVQAYGKLAGANWTYFIQTLTVSVGRAPDPGAEASSDRAARAKAGRTASEEHAAPSAAGPQMTPADADPGGAADKDEGDGEPGAEAGSTGRAPSAVSGGLVASSGGDRGEAPVATAVQHGESGARRSAAESRPAPHQNAQTVPTAVDVDLGPAKIVSRRHASVEFNFTSRRWNLHAIGRNGLKVNDVVFKPGCDPIELDMLIEVGGVQFVFILPEGLLTGAPEQAQATEESAAASAKSDSRPSPALPAEGVDYRPDRVRDVKPPLSYTALIAQVINAAPARRLSLPGIYQGIAEKYAFYRHAPPGWQSSVRHNLSTGKLFRKIARGEDEPGKGMFWTVDPEHAATLEEGAAKRKKTGAGSGEATHAHDADGDGGRASEDEGMPDCDQQ